MATDRSKARQVPASREPTGSSVLAVEWEPQVWDEEVVEYRSRRQQREAQGTYLAAVPARIADAQILLSSAVVAEAAEAESAIVRFDETIDRDLPALAGSDGGSARELSPLAAVLLRTESASSSQIEQITAGSQALALAVIDEKAGPNAKLVAANVSAMQAAVGMAADFGIESILAAHEALLGHSDPDIAGAFRTAPVWVGGRGGTPHTAEFVPPAWTHVQPAMEDLVAFTQRTDIPALTQVAIAHAQFETVHPFPDGNGRVGRAMVHSLLRQYGTTRRVTIPVSAGLLADTAAYFDALTAYRLGDPAPIVSRFAEATFAAVNNGQRLATDLVSIMSDWQDRVRARRDAAAWKVLPVLLSQPAVTSAVVAQAVNVSQPAADGAIAHLVDVGILTPVSANRRNRVFTAQSVIEALDAFAVRAGRRRWVG